MSIFGEHPIVRVLALCMPVSLLSVADVLCSGRGCWCAAATGAAAAAVTAGASAAAGTSLG